jgi:hypothetical protein
MLLKGHERVTSDWIFLVVVRFMYTKQRIKVAQQIVECARFTINICGFVLVRQTTQSKIPYSKSRSFFP